MSRSFAPLSGVDYISFAPGMAPPDQGPITIAVLAKAHDLGGFVGWMLSGRKAGSAVLGLLTASAKLYSENDFGVGVAGLSTSWRWYVMTKPSGNVPPRIHVWDLATAWTHTTDTANVGDGTGPIDALYVGGTGAGTNGWRGSIAVAAMWAVELSDTQIESTMTLKAYDTYSSGAVWMTRFNQVSTAITVTDDTGGGGDQIALVGTTVDADDPPGFDYSIAAPAPPTPTPPSRVLTAGSWWGLESTLDASRSLIQWWNTRQPVACPNDGEPLRRSVDGILYCPFDNWRPYGQNIRRGAQLGRDWAQLSSIKKAAAQDAAINQLLLACPNDGEPLSIGKHGERFCRYDGWMPPDPVN